MGHGLETQNAMVFDHLVHLGPITPLEALHNYGCFRLAARIFDLRSRGHLIETSRIDIGEGRRVARYWLKRAKWDREEEAFE